jgi:hypothetical protein
MDECPDFTTLSPAPWANASQEAANPDLPGGAGVVVSTDTPHRWALSVGHDPSLDEARWRELIRVATGVPDLEPALVSGGAASGHTAGEPDDLRRALDEVLCRG